MKKYICDVFELVSVLFIILIAQKCSHARNVVCPPNYERGCGHIQPTV